MPTWITDNSTWVFSGIGVFLLGIAIAGVKHFTHRERPGNADNSGPAQNVSVGGDISANGDVHIQQSHQRIVSLLTVGISKKAFNRGQSELKKDRGRDKVREWGRKMSSANEWDWRLLGQALEHYFEAIQSDPENQHPWTNVTYVFHAIGDHENALECLKKSKGLAGLGPNYPGRNYERVDKAVKKRIISHGWANPTPGNSFLVY